jgi:hypothetical protein
MVSWVLIFPPRAWVDTLARQKLESWGRQRKISASIEAKAGDTGAFPDWPGRRIKNNRGFFDRGH